MEKALKYKVIFHIVFPILIGGLIYISFREPSLIMFKWFEKLKLLNFILLLRKYITNIITFYPKWLVYSLPQGLWIYAFTSSIIIIWKEYECRIKYFWFAFAFFLVFFIEFAQFYNILPGTFDYFDLLFNIIFFYFSIISLYWRDFNEYLY